jgi:hypothetical protein
MTKEVAAAISEAIGDAVPGALEYQSDTTQKDDVAAMLGISGDLPVIEQTQEEEQQIEEELQSDELIDPELEQEEEASTEEEATEETSEPAQSKEDLLLEALTEIRKELAELKEKNEEQKEEKPEESKDIEFVTEDGYAEILQSKDGLNKVLNALYQQVRQAALQDAFPIIQQEVTRSNTVFAHTKAFYEANEDLKKHTNLVQQVFKEIVAKKPDITIENLFSEAAPEARKRLKLTTNPTVRKTQPPTGFATPAKGGRGPTTAATKTNSQKQQIADLLKGMK